MKILLHIILLLPLLAPGVLAQNSAPGLYLTAADYVNRKLSYQSKHTHIRCHELFRNNSMQVKYHDTLFTFQKDNVFGFADKNGTYRFVNGLPYAILNPGEHIVIYEWQSGTGLKNTALADTYYFSKDAAAPVQLLTLGNILQTFEDNPPFSALLEICFTRDAELLKYDEVHQQYRINSLLDLTHK